ncbi:hypothetical protein ACUR5C_02535 [Aliikangiella sp. IMCC44653]
MITQPIQLISATPFGEFEKMLKADLLSLGSQVVDSNQPKLSRTQTTELSRDRLQLQLLPIQFVQQGVSRDATGRANEIQVTASLEYRVSQIKNGMQSEPLVKKITLKKGYYQDFRNPIGHQNQLRQTKSEIYRELSQKLLRQLSLMEL